MDECLQKVGFISGYFNPLHSGHLSMINEARKLIGENGIIHVIVNNDLQVKIKGSKPFMSENERKEIIDNLKPVDKSTIAYDDSGNVSFTLEKLTNDYNARGNYKFLFLKGGDRSDNSKMPDDELDVCRQRDIEIVYGVGGFDKKNSSSEILKNYE